MSKKIRQQALLEIVSEKVVPSQALLADELRQRGHAVTQTTLCRDIAELNLVKSKNGYRLPEDIGSAGVGPGGDPRKVLRAQVLKVETSLNTGLDRLAMSPGVMDALEALRGFLHKRVYEDTETLREFKKARKMLLALYEYYMEHPDEVFKDIPADKKPDKRRSVCDFIAGMTDRYAIEAYEDKFVPRQWGVY